jgi:hypothetical protein
MLYGLFNIQIQYKMAVVLYQIKSKIPDICLIGSQYK